MQELNRATGARDSSWKVFLKSETPWLFVPCFPFFFVLANATGNNEPRMLAGGMRRVACAAAASERARRLCKGVRPNPTRPPRRRSRAQQNSPCSRTNHAMRSAANRAHEHMKPPSVFRRARCARRARAHHRCRPRAPATYTTHRPSLFRSRRSRSPKTAPPVAYAAIFCSRRVCTRAS